MRSTCIVNRMCFGESTPHFAVSASAVNGGRHACENCAFSVLLAASLSALIQQRACLFREDIKELHSSWELLWSHKKPPYRN